MKRVWCLDYIYPHLWKMNLKFKLSKVNSLFILILHLFNVQQVERSLKCATRQIIWKIDKQIKNFDNVFDQYQNIDKQLAIERKRQQLDSADKHALAMNGCAHAWRKRIAWKTSALCATTSVDLNLELTLDKNACRKLKRCSKFKFKLFKFNRNTCSIINVLLLQDLFPIDALFLPELFPKNAHAGQNM